MENGMFGQCLNEDYRVLGMTSRALLLMASTEALLLALVPSLGATVVIWILHPNDAYVLAALAAGRRDRTSLDLTSPWPNYDRRA